MNVHLTILTQLGLKKNFIVEQFAVNSEIVQLTQIIEIFSLYLTGRNLQLSKPLFTVIRGWSQCVRGRVKKFEVKHNFIIF
jgi:hypothetical protein